LQESFMPSFIGLCVLLGVGHLLRSKVKLLRWLYLPSCVIGGLVGLIAIQCITAWGGDAGASILSTWTAGWSKLPGLLINVVFACLFLGIALPKFSELCKRAGPQLAYGQIVAWGQYVVGIGLFLFVISLIWPDQFPSMFGGIMPVGFEGGHGTATGMKSVFDKYGWEIGIDFALASATVGLISAVVVGMLLVNIASRCGWVTKKVSPSTIAEDDSIGVIPVDERPEAGKLTVRSDAIESFTIQLVMVGIACGIGWGVKQGVVVLAEWMGHEKFVEGVSGFPLFPLCMLGGLLVQWWEDRFDRAKVIDAGLMKRIQNVSLDFLVVAAIAMIRIEVLAASWVPFVILMVGGILWNVICLLVVARWALPNAWFERGIAEMGQSMGVTATGLLLLRVVDPDYETPAADAFASKQLLHEPFMGGGLWTSSAMLLLATWGAWPVWWIAVSVMAGWLLVIAIFKTVFALRARAN
jgi:ESS family glutamate:Na+ symporter